MAKQRRTQRGATQALQRDKYALYQQAVQEPESQCQFFDRVFRSTYGRPAEVLREDFCGTAAVCCQWVRTRRTRRAYGIDLDPQPLRWGSSNNVAQLKPDQQQRVQLLQQDVREVGGVKADVIAAENFSYFIFKTRNELRYYLQAARRNLAREGLLVLDIMGGPQSIEEDREEKRRLRGFTYVWEQARFDPITHHCTFFIHFRFPDGSEQRRAFRYDWRMWTIPELCELLLEAGFMRADVYWEDADENGECSGIYRRQKHAPSDPAWVSYVVGVK